MVPQVTVAERILTLVADAAQGRFIPCGQDFPGELAHVGAAGVSGTLTSPSRLTLAAARS